MSALKDLFLRRRSANYRDLFATPMGQRVLADLLAFCNDARLYSGNAIEMAQAVGRYQVREHLILVMQYDAERIRQLNVEEDQRRAREVA